MTEDFSAHVSKHKHCSLKSFTGLYVEIWAVKTEKSTLSFSGFENFLSYEVVSIDLIGQLTTRFAKRQENCKAQFRLMKKFTI